MMAGPTRAPSDEVEEPVLEGSFELEGFKVRPAYQILVDRFSAWTLDQISQYTDIPLDVIEEVASIYLSGRSMVLLGFGQDHYANGQTFYDGVFALADITGQECKHGSRKHLRRFDWSCGAGRSEYCRYEPGWCCGWAYSVCEPSSSVSGGRIDWGIRHGAAIDVHLLLQPAG